MEDAIGKICKKNKLLSRLILFLINFSDAANDAAAQAEESKDPNRLLRLS